MPLTLAAAGEENIIRKVGGNPEVKKHLEELGFVVTVQGKGTFVASGNQDLLREERIRHVEESLERAIADARPLGLTADDLHEMLDLLLED